MLVVDNKRGTPHYWIGLKRETGCATRNEQVRRTTSISHCRNTASSSFSQRSMKTLSEDKPHRVPSWIYCLAISISFDWLEATCRVAGLPSFQLMQVADWYRTEKLLQRWKVRSQVRVHLALGCQGPFLGPTPSSVIEAEGWQGRRWCRLVSRELHIRV